MNQRHRALPAEIHIGLVNHHDIIRVRRHDPLNISQGNGQSGGSIGIGNENGLVNARVILHMDGKILSQRNGLIGHSVQIRKDGVEAIGNVREHGGVLFVAEGHEGEIQNLVAAVGEKNFVLSNAEQLTGRPHQLPALRVGIELEIFCCLRCQLHRKRGGREWGFVGIELDVAHLFRLFSRHIGHQRGVFFTEIAAHASSS